MTYDDAVSLCRQVEGRDYNPPRRARILEWDARQQFVSCPDPNLEFPEHVYEHSGVLSRAGEGLRLGAR